MLGGSGDGGGRRPYGDERRGGEKNDEADDRSLCELSRL